MNYKNFITFVVVLCLPLYLLNEKLGWVIPIAGLSLVIYAVFQLWNHVLWKVKKLGLPLFGNLVGFSNRPDLSGEWKVECSSSYFYDKEKGEYTKTIKGTAKITQSYCDLHVDGIFDGSSKFESLSTFWDQKKGGKWYLCYLYENSPTDTALQHSNSGGMHKGFCYLEVIDNNTLEGFYSNDENRKTRGKITFKRR